MLSLLCFPIPGRLSTTKSEGGRAAWLIRNDSLTVRLTRLRATAPPVDLIDIAIPNLDPLPVAGRASTVKSLSAERTLP